MKSVCCDREEAEDIEIWSLMALHRLLDLFSHWFCVNSHF